MNIKKIYTLALFAAFLSVFSNFAMDSDDLDATQPMDCSEPMDTDATETSKPTPSFINLQEAFWRNDSQAMRSLAAAGAGFTQAQLEQTAETFKACKNNETLILDPNDEHPLTLLERRTIAINTRTAQLSSDALNAQWLRKEAIRKTFHEHSPMPSTIIDLICQFNP